MSVESREISFLNLLLECFTKEKVRELKEALENNREVIVIGPPCSGKSHIIEKSGFKDWVKKVTPLPQKGENWEDLVERYENEVIVALTSQVIETCIGRKLTEQERELLKQFEEDYFGFKYYPLGPLKLALDNPDEFEKSLNKYKEAKELLDLFEPDIKELVRNAGRELATETTGASLQGIAQEVLGSLLGTLVQPLTSSFLMLIFITAFEKLVGATKVHRFLQKTGKAGAKLYSFFQKRGRSPLTLLLEFFSLWKELNEEHKKLLVAHIASMYAKNDEEYAKLRNDVFGQLENLSSQDLEELRKRIEEEVYNKLRRELEKELGPLRVLAHICLKPEDLGIDLKNRKLEARLDEWVELVAFPDKSEEIVKQVYKVLDENHIIILHGKKGVGKSTLARYALAEAIKDGLVGAIFLIKSTEQVINIAEVAKRYNIPILFDPSPPRIYEMSRYKKPLDKISPYIEPLAELVNWEVKGVVVLPDDIYKSLDNVLRNEGLPSLEDLKKSGLVEIGVDLRDLGFLERVVRAYSDCDEKAVKEIAEKVSKFDSYTLVAKYAGIYLKEEKCKLKELFKALEEARGNVKKFLTLIILDTLTAETDYTVERLEAVFPALILHTVYGPLPLKIPVLLAEELVGVRVDNYFRRQLCNWFSQEKEDLVQEVLLDLAFRGENYGYKADYMQEAREKLEEKGLKLFTESTLVELTEKASHLLLEKLNRLASELSPECWRRAVYIIGSAISGHSFSTSFNRYAQLREVPKIAERHEELDGLLLARDDLPPSTRAFTMLLARKSKLSLKPIKESHEIVDEARKLLQRRFSLCLIPYLAGLALATFKQQPSDALYLLNWVIRHLGPHANLKEVTEILYTIGEVLDWPGELAPFLHIMVNRYAEFEPELHEPLKDTARMLLERGKLEAWSKAYLAEMLAELAKLEVNVLLSREALNLLEEIKQEDALMGYIASACVNFHLAELYMMRKDLDEARKCLDECDNALERARQALTSGLSENVRKFLMFISSAPPEKAIQSCLQDIGRFRKFQLAQLCMFKGLLKDDKEKLKEAEKIFLEVAEEYRKSKIFTNYLVAKNRALRIRVLCADNFSEELCHDFRKLWTDTRKLVLPLRKLPSSLAYYLVALALTGGNWRELLNKHGFLLRYDPQCRIAVLLLLSLIAQQEPTLALSNREIYRAIEMEVRPVLRPALKISLGLINEEEARKLCHDLAYDKMIKALDEGSNPETAEQESEEILRICSLSIDAALGRDAPGNFRKLVLNQLGEMGIDIEKVEKEKLSEHELVELIAPYITRGTFILLLKALIEGNYKLARAHALYWSMELPLFKRLYDALKAEELNDEVKLYLVKLYYFHI